MATEKFEQEIGYKITGAETTKKQAGEIKQAVEDLHKIAGESAGELIGKEQVEHVNEIKEIYEDIIKEKNKSLKKESKQIKKNVKVRMTAARVANKQLGKPIRGGAAGFLETGKAKAGGVKGAFKGIGGSLKGMAKMGGKMTKVMGSLSGVMSAIGISLGALSSIGAFVALLVAADKHVKEMNTSILNTVANTGELNAVFGDVPDIEPEFNIKNIRHSMNNLFEDYRVGQQDALDSLKAFGDQGIEVKSILGNTIKETKRFKREGEYTLEGIQTATVFAHQLGKDTATTAGMMAEWSATLGISVSSLKGDFTKLTKDAKTSGLGVNRFFAAVQNASSGLEMYGIRTTEVSDTLNKLGQVGTGSMEGTTEATKSLIGAMSKVTKETAAYFASSSRGRKQITGAIQNELKTSDKRLKGLTGNISLQKVMTMTAEEQNEAFKGNAKEVRMIAFRMKELQSSMKGIEAGKVLEVQRAMKRLGPGELMKIYVEQSAKALGKSPATFKFTDLTSEELLILEQTLGLSTENLEEMKRVAFGIESGNSSTLEGLNKLDDTNKENLKNMYDTMDKQAKKAAKAKTPMTAIIGEITNSILTNLFDLSSWAFNKLVRGFGHLLIGIGKIPGISNSISDFGQTLLDFSTQQEKEELGDKMDNIADGLDDLGPETTDQTKELSNQLKRLQDNLKAGIDVEQTKKEIGTALQRTGGLSEDVFEQMPELKAMFKKHNISTSGITSPAASATSNVSNNPQNTNNIGGSTTNNYNTTVKVNGGDPKKLEEVVEKVIYKKELRDKV